jgi:hypothetical protein
MTGTVDSKDSPDVYRAKRGRIRIVDVPDMRYLMIDGNGDPNTSSAYSEALKALYPVACSLKFASRRDLERDYVVPPTWHHAIYLSDARKVIPERVRTVLRQPVLSTGASQGRTADRS